jgi:hypothetical protein
MNDPTKLEDLRDPQIEQANWRTELPEHTRQAAQLLHRHSADLQSFVDYHLAAQTRSDIVNQLRAASDAFQQAAESMQSAASLAEQWANDVELPRYDRAS